MDGYTTAVKSTPVEWITKARGFGISCWIRVDAYPWNDLPIMDQVTPERSFFFGIDAEGHLIASLTARDGVNRATSVETLPLRQWVLVILASDGEGQFTLTLDEKVLTSKRFLTTTSLGTGSSVESGLLIGHVRTPLLPGAAELIHPQFAAEYSLEGSVGSVTIYDHPLNKAELSTLWRGRRTDQAFFKQAPAPVFPRGDGTAGSFGAFYTHLKYDPAWDRTRRLQDDTDVVVRFPDALIRLIFWQGTNYVPAWVTENNHWYSDEFMEIYGHPRCPNGEDCEPMSDKQVRYSQVKILENTPARVLIHWRYALSEVERYAIADAMSPTAWGDWADEYWTVFPDGVAIRRQIFWSTNPERESTEFQESIVLVPAGERPEDSINYDALTFVSLKGASHTYKWALKSDSAPSRPKVADHFNEPADAVIQWVNLKSVWKPFQVAWGDPVTFDSYTREKSLSAFEWWNHWPVAQIPSSGRPALAPDRPGHTSLSHIYWPFSDKRPASVEKVLMMGLTAKPATELVPLALSWRQPAAAQITGGASIRYDESQRAYVITDPGSSIFSVTLHGSKTNPVINPSFVIQTKMGVLSMTALVESAAAQPSIATGRVEGLNDTKLFGFISLSAEKDVRISFDIKR